MSDRENVLALMRETNKATVKRMKDRVSVVDASQCIALPVMEVDVEAHEQTFKNQEFIIERLIVNGNSKKPDPVSTIKKPAKKFNLFGIFTAEGFDMRDIVRLILVMSMIYFVYHTFQIQTSMDKVGSVIQTLQEQNKGESHE